MQSSESMGINDKYVRPGGGWVGGWTQVAQHTQVRYTERTTHESAEQEHYRHEAYTSPRTYLARLTVQ